MKVMVSGASGFVGGALVQSLQMQNIDVYPLYYTNKITHPCALQCNLADISILRKIAERILPDVFIHCAAMTNVDYCEKHKFECWDTNVQNTVNVCRSIGKKTHLVYISTSQVFDGKVGKYRESATKNPINWYGISKDAAEETVMNLAEMWSIVRLSNQYGFDPKGRNFVHNAYSRLLKGESVKAAGDKIASFTYIGTTATALSELLEGRREGLYHVADLEPATKYDILLKLASSANKKELVIKEDAANILDARRPNNSSLAVSKVSKTFKKTHPLTLSEGISRFLEDFHNHTRKRIQ